MNPRHAIHRLIHILAGLAGAAVAYAIAVMPAALAATSPRPARPAPASSRPANWPHLPPGWNKHPPLPAHVHPVTTGGMPGWQVTLIAAAVLAAAAAVTMYRMRAAQRRVNASAARA